MEKPNFRLFLVQLPALTGVQPQTEGLRDSANSKGKAARCSPELSVATAVFCSGLTSVCWSENFSAPGTGLQAKLAPQPHRQQCHQRDKNKGDLLYSPEIPHIKKENKKMRLAPRLPRQHPESWLGYPSDILLVANYLLHFPAFLDSESKKHFTLG